MFAPLLAIGFVLAVFAVLMGLFHTVPVHRWSFEVGGRWVEVRNFVMREEVWVDGTLRPHTRRDGDHFTWARHAVQVAGDTLLVGIRSEGLSVHCEAAYRDVVVFDSRTASGILQPTKTSKPIPADGDEPRLAAVLSILRELADSHDPETLARVPPLKAEVLDLLGRIARAERAAEAHSVLGGGDDARDVLLTLEGDLAPLLDELRELHVVELAGPSAGARITSRSFRQVAADVQPRTLKGAG